MNASRLLPKEREPYRAEVAELLTDAYFGLGLQAVQDGLAANLLRGDIALWYPEDYPDCRDKVTILDVRTPAEYGAWHIPGAVLLPFTELRQRLDEVPRDKPVYTYCRSGFRSYIAYCVLKQNGWDQAAFLSGGTMTYHGYHRTPLTVGKGGMPMVAHAEDELAHRPGALDHV